MVRAVHLCQDWGSVGGEGDCGLSQHDHHAAQHDGDGGEAHHLSHQAEEQHLLRTLLHPPRQPDCHGPRPSRHHVGPQHAALQSHQEERQQAQQEGDEAEEEPQGQDYRPHPGWYCHRVRFL